MKQIFMLICALWLDTYAFAQTPTHWQPYVRAGIGASRTIGEKTASPGGILLPFPFNSDMGQAVPTKLGGNQWLLVGNFGAGVTIPVDQHFSIQAEVNVEQKGSALDLTRATTGIICDPAACPVYSITGHLSSRLTYLTLPVMVSYRFKRISLSAGPYVSYKVAEQRYGTYALGTSTDNHEIRLTNGGYSNFDVGFVAGITYTATSHLDIDLRYSQGLRYIAKPYRYSYFGYYSDEETEPFYNQTTQFAVRYNIHR